VDASYERGALLLNFPEVPADGMEAMPDTCSLDRADRGPSILEEVGARLNLTRERIRQIEARALRKLRNTAPEVFRQMAKDKLE